MREHLENEKSSWFLDFQVLFYLACVVVVPILIAIYYNIGKSVGGAIVMAITGIGLEFITLTVAALLVDEKCCKAKGEMNCAVKDFIVDLLFNILFCSAIIVAKHHGVAVYIIFGSFCALGIIALVAGVFILASLEKRERG